MAGKLNTAIAAAGVTAYQDHIDPKKFHYMPNRVDSVLGETLKSFECKYYGIGGDAFYKRVDGASYNVSGGTVTGQAVPDMTAEQKSVLLKEIEKVTKISDPYLAAITVDNGTIQPVFANAVAAEGEGSSSTFPSKFQFGSQFNFAVASGNSLFPQLVAVSNSAQKTDVSSFISTNFYGTTKLYGDPWTALIKADLSQVWEYVRNKGDAGVSAGWLSFGAAWDNIAQELKKESIITMEFREGTGGDEFGRSMLEATRKVFEAINGQITAGEGMFKFDPNPTPQEPPKREGNWGSSLLPYTLSVNLSFSKNSLKQGIKFSEEVSFTGIRDVPVISSMNLSGICDRNTVGMFMDVQHARNGCIDAETMAGWDKRLRAEQTAKTKKTQEYEEMFIAGKITFDQYEKLLALLATRTLTEALNAKGDRLSVEAASAALDDETFKYGLFRR